MMTPNKLTVYFVADTVLADMVVADIDFPCGRYVLLWPIWFVADMVAPRVSVRVKVQPTNITC